MLAERARGVQERLVLERPRQLEERERGAREAADEVGLTARPADCRVCRGLGEARALGGDLARSDQAAGCDGCKGDAGRARVQPGVVRARARERAWRSAPAAVAATSSSPVAAKRCARYQATPLVPP